MKLNLSEEQEMLKETARDFLADRCPRAFVRQMEESDTGYSRELWQDMVRLGWVGLAFPERYGGGGMGFLGLAVLLEEMGRVCLPGPFFSTVVLGGLTILDIGSERQKQEYLPQVIRGERMLALALTEPVFGSCGATEVSVAAIPEGDDYIIDGRKLFVYDAHIADYLLCITRTEPENGITAFVVDAKSPHVRCTLLKSIAGDRQCEVIFDRATVPATGVLGRADYSQNVVQGMVERATAAKCCEMVGNVQRVLEMTLDYAKERTQFGKPIGSFQVIQHYCADMATDVDGARLAAYQAAWMLDQGLPCATEVAIAKIWMSEASQRVMNLAHQIHGAIGVSMEHDLHFYTRRAKAAESAFGDASFYREIVAKEMAL
jgi:3-oxocholest-4-en-26-oyl-CoA dehydrogenase beta subunit